MLYALPIIDKINELSMMQKLTVEQKSEGKRELLRVVADCELDELCLLRQMPLLKDTFEKNHNPMIVGFVEYLFLNQETLKKDATECGIDEKKEMRKVFAMCLKERIKTESESFSLTVRAKIDKLNDLEDICLKENMEKLAKEGNIFAQAMMVNLYQLIRNEEKMNYWYNQMQKNANMEKYEQFMKCSELP